MKKLILQITLGLAMVAGFTACKDKTVEQPRSSNVVKIENDDDKAEFGYNQAGQISSMTIKDNTGAILVNYAFAYNSGKITEVAGAGQKWKYTYTGNLVTKVEVTAANVVVRKYEYTYANGKLASQTESAKNVQGGLEFETKTQYSYTTAGNVSKAEVFDFINNGWVKSDEIRVTAYDNKVNATIQYENFPYLPNFNFVTNNPLVEEHRTPTGVVYATVNYEYTYDNSGRVVTRKMKHQVIGFPLEVYNTKYIY
jgi:hypothetical protein